MADSAIALEMLHSAQGAIIITKLVNTSVIATKGMPAKLSSATQAENAAAVTDNAVGIFLDSGVATDKVRIALWGKGVCKALVATAGATRGAPAKFASGGLTDATQGGGTVKQVICGQFLESGTVGELVGLNLGGFSWGVSA